MAELISAMDNGQVLIESIAIAVVVLMVAIAINHIAGRE